MLISFTNHPYGYAQKCRNLGIVVSVALSAVYIVGSKWFFNLFFADNDSIELGMKFSVVAAVLTFLQIVRIVDVGVMRGIGDVKTPMILATVCVLLVNPGTGFLLVVVMNVGIWGVWISSIITQSIWFVAAIVKTRKLLSNVRSGYDSGDSSAGPFF